ncbi:hypothetical protein TeGR_g2409, partial [Tetraparma gracilis]
MLLCFRRGRHTPVTAVGLVFPGEGEGVPRGYEALQRTPAGGDATLAAEGGREGLLVVRQRLRLVERLAPEAVVEGVFRGGDAHVSVVYGTGGVVDRVADGVPIKGPRHGKARAWGGPEGSGGESQDGSDDDDLSQSTDTTTTNTADPPPPPDDGPEDPQAANDAGVTRADIRRAVSGSRAAYLASLPPGKARYAALLLTAAYRQGGGGHALAVAEARRLVADGWFGEGPGDARLLEDVLAAVCDAVLGMSRAAAFPAAVALCREAVKKYPDMDVKCTGGILRLYTYVQSYMGTAPTRNELTSPFHNSASSPPDAAETLVADAKSGMKSLVNSVLVEGARKGGEEDGGARWVGGRGNEPWIRGLVLSVVGETLTRVELTAHAQRVLTLCTRHGGPSGGDSFWVEMVRIGKRVFGGQAQQVRAAARRELPRSGAAALLLAFFGARSCFPN